MQNKALHLLLTPQTDVPILQIEDSPVLKRVTHAGLFAVCVLILAYVTYAYAQMQVSPFAVHLIFSYLQLLNAAFAFLIALSGKIVGALRFFVVGMLAVVSVQPYLVESDLLWVAFMVNPLIVISMLMLIALLYSRKVMTVMLVGSLLSLLTVIGLRGEAKTLVRLPIFFFAVVGVVAALYLWSEIVNHVLERNKAAMEKAQEHARERDLMLRETHHRVKNNLGIVNALIRMKRESLPEDHSIGDLSRQIETIMLLHEKLYRQEASEENSVHLQRHLRDVLEIVFSHPQNAHVQVKTALEEDPAVDPAKAVPLGLIVHELAMNAVKHSFSASGREYGEQYFGVEGGYASADGHFYLSVTHSGPPLPENFSFLHRDTFGLQLVESLVRQLKGKIEVRREPTPGFVIRFPL